MKYIIDTHIFIWLIKHPKKISKEQVIALKNPNNQIYISNISFWEISLKYNKGKIDLLGFSPNDLPIVAKELNLKIMDIDAQTMANSYQLTKVEQHKDPFDRMLIWFCIQNNHTFISNDDRLNEYKQQGLKWI